MYGKHFESMYEGSMYGAGLAVFAVWGYVISHTRGGVIELNPRRLADTLGGTVEEIVAAIRKLETPDPESRHKECEGRRLVREGEFQYRVPSWDAYQQLRDANDLREYNREAKRRQRAKRKPHLEVRPGETIRQAIARKIAPEVAADQAAVDAPVVPGTGIKPATSEECQEWLEQMRKDCPEVFDKNLGEGLGPAIAPSASMLDFAAPENPPAALPAEPPPASPTSA